jgi:hypothetical protein
MFEYRDMNNNVYKVIQSTRTPVSDDDETIKESILDDLYNIFTAKQKVS